MKVEYQGNQTYLYTGGEEHHSQRETLVFIHGAAMDHTVWTLYARYWAKAGYNVVALDLPGHGLSKGDVLKTIEENAVFVCGLLEDLKLDHAVTIVGHSMGSLIALECASRLSGLRRLLMLGTAVPMGVSDALLEAAKANDHSAIDMISLFGHCYASQLGGNPIAGVSVQLFAERLLESAAPGVLYNDLHACREYKGGIKAAQKIQSPVGLILGALDQMTHPSGAVEVFETFKNASKIVLPDCGHMMMSEKPELTHKAICELVKS